MSKLDNIARNKLVSPPAGHSPTLLFYSLPSLALLVYFIHVELPAQTRAKDATLEAISLVTSTLSWFGVF